MRDFPDRARVGFAFVGNQSRSAIRTSTWTCSATCTSAARRPTFGILLCKAKNNVIVEYALRDMSRSARRETRLVESLPKELDGRLPTVEQLEAEIAEDDDGS